MWEESIRGDRFALSKKEALTWLNCKTWSVIDAACLLNAITNDGECVSLQQLEPRTEFICKQILEHIEDESPLSEINKVCSLYGHKTKIRDQFQFAPWDDLDVIRFPVCAYFIFAMEELFPQEKGGYDLPCFGIFHDLDRETPEQDAIEPMEPEFVEALSQLGCNHPLLAEMQEDVSPRETVLENSRAQEKKGGEPQVKIETRPDDQIIKGVTVADIRAMTDKSNPRYRNELHAALCVWASFERDPVPEGLTPKGAVLQRINQWAEDHDEYFRDSDISRISVMVNWDKNGNKQKPKKR